MDLLQKANSRLNNKNDTSNHENSCIICTKNESLWKQIKELFKLNIFRKVKENKIIYEIQVSVLEDLHKEANNGGGKQI